MRALFLGRNAEAAEFQPRGALADAEVEPAVGDDVERRQALGRARRVVVVGDHLADAVADADVLGQRRAGGQEHLRRGGVGVFLQEVVLDLPGVVVAQPVGEHDLLQRLVEQPRLVALVPGLGQLVLVEDPEPHASLRWLVAASERPIASARKSGALNEKAGDSRLRPFRILMRR